MSFITTVSFSFALVAICTAASIEKLSPGGNGWGNPTSTSTGFSGLSAIQSGNAAQSFSFQANGTGMGITLLSNVITDGNANLVQTGGNSEETVADVNVSAGSSGIIPESTIQLELSNSDTVNLELDTQAVGWEEVSTAVEQQAQIIGGGSDAGGWGSGGGWPASSGASLGNEQKVL